MKEEIWKQAIHIASNGEITKLYNIEASNFGRIKYLNYKNTGKVVIQDFSKQNRRYYSLTIYVDKMFKSFSVHRIITSTFKPISETYASVNHIDENTHNNMITNLEWCSMETNTNSGSRNYRAGKSISKNKKGRLNVGNIKSVVQYLPDMTFISEYPSINEAERVTGINHSKIVLVCNGKRNTAGGYIWKYKKAV